MAKITYYPKVTKLADKDIFLIDGADGTRTVETKYLATELQNRLDVDVYDYLDKMNIPVEMRRNIFRGKNLGSSYTSDQKARVADGSFKGIFIGDYFNIKNHIWRVVDIDYWYNTGDTTYWNKHHLVIMPDKTLYSSKMNDSDTAEGGYVGSLLYKSGLNNAKTLINECFGDANVLSHRELLTNSSNQGVSWFDSTVEIPNEIMLTGTNYHTYSSTIDTSQLSLMNLSNQFIHDSVRGWFWLRDFSNPYYFGVMYGAGNLGQASASANIALRPVFGIY